MIPRNKVSDIVLCALLMLFSCYLKGCASHSPTQAGLALVYLELYDTVIERQAELLPGDTKLLKTLNDRLAIAGTIRPQTDEAQLLNAIIQLTPIAVDLLKRRPPDGNLTD